VVDRVELSRLCVKQLRKVPRHVVVKLQGWVQLVETQGLQEARKISGYHDEPLGGKLRGKRSIRLSRAYRAVYHIDDDGNVQVVIVEEVTKHEY
jgi:proteic killer suppression protein